MEKKIVLKVNDSNKLIDILGIKLKDLSNKSIKNYIKNDMVFVNNKIEHNPNRLLDINDEIIFYFNKEEQINFDIIYEDNDIIVVNKPNGLLTIGNNKERERTLFRLVSNYVKRQSKNNKIFVVHRLDEETSGIVLFAKNEYIKNYLYTNWNNIVKVREYICIIPGKVDNNGTIESFLDYDHNQIGHSVKYKTNNYAVSNYSLIDYKNNLSLVRVLISTGKRNQIRIHMKENFRPIIGDKKYRSYYNPINRLCLHAKRLVLIYNKKEIEFDSNIPNCFIELMNKGL